MGALHAAAERGNLKWETFLFSLSDAVAAADDEPQPGNGPERATRWGSNAARSTFH